LDFFVRFGAFQWVTSNPKKKIVDPGEGAILSGASARPHLINRRHSGTESEAGMGRDWRPGSAQAAAQRLRCSTKRINHSWSTASKNPWMSASSTQPTFVLSIPTHRASERRASIRPFGRCPVMDAVAGRTVVARAVFCPRGEYIFDAFQLHPGATPAAGMVFVGTKCP